MKRGGLGKRGELYAESFLKEKGFLFITKNYHSRFGEIDLVFYDTKSSEYVFVEVKTRASDFFGSPQESITPSKIKKIYKTAYDFFWKFDRPYPSENFRIDALCLIAREDAFVVDHFEQLHDPFSP